MRAHTNPTHAHKPAAGAEGAKQHKAATSPGAKASKHKNTHKATSEQEAHTSAHRQAKAQANKVLEP